MYLWERRIIWSTTRGMARLRVDWLTPEQSAISLWNDPVAKKPSVLSTSVGTGTARLLAVVRWSAGRSSSQSCSKMARGSRNRLISHSSQFWSKSSRSMN